MNAPTAIGRYQVRERLGQGGMGTLFLALDPAIDRLVALKVLRVDDPDVRERFEREARFAARLQHPNIVTIYDVGEHEGQPFIAMEYIPGDTLDDGHPAAGANRSATQAGDARRRLRRARLRPQAWHRPSRREAGQPDREPRVADREDPRLRDRPRRRVGPDAGGHGDRHAALHVARTGAWRAGRSSQRHLRRRARPVRAARLSPRLRGRLADRGPAEDSERSAA